MSSKRLSLDKVLDSPSLCYARPERRKERDMRKVLLRIISRLEKVVERQRKRVERLERKLEHYEEMLIDIEEKDDGEA